MKARIEYKKVNPSALQAMLALQGVVDNSGLEHRLLYLVKLRASQINGCAYCIDMHTKDAIYAGESDQRLYGLDAWHETPYYSDRERAALAWTEAVTNISSTHVPDAVYDDLRAHFSEDEIVNLTLAVATVNAWNRLAVSLRTVPGDYRPGMLRKSGDVKQPATV
jgi:AhpD family alkylhydroperoxidase